MATEEATKAGGFSEAERKAMKARAAELRAEGRKGAKAADGLDDLLAKIAEMSPEDRSLAERVHVTITAAGPSLVPRTWYGMPAYSDDAGKLVVAFKPSGKFGQRYSTLEFQERARLDDSEMWPVSFALTQWTSSMESRIRDLVVTALS